jgi:hypothetical protein
MNPVGESRNMISELALWQQVSLFVLALLSAIYIFYFRIWVALAAGSDLVFAAALLGCIASIAVPRLFEEGAQRVVGATTLPAALQDLDARVAALEALPGELIDRALERIGYERESGPDEEAAAGPGPFESRVRPAVEALVAFVLRATSFIASIFMLLLALALRSSTAAAREIHKLSARLDGLSTGEREVRKPAPA